MLIFLEILQTFLKIIDKPRDIVYNDKYFYCILKGVRRKLYRSLSAFFSITEVHLIYGYDLKNGSGIFRSQRI